MAKKSVGKTQDKEAKNQVKLIRSIKNPETGRYNFREEMVSRDEANQKVSKK